jgi:beta-galactosidase
MAEVSRSTLETGGRDCAVINVSVCDAQGRVVPTANVPVSFRVSPNARILGVGNGDPSCHEPDVCLNTPWQRSTFNGWCQVIVASPKTPGAAMVNITANGLQPAEVNLQAK